MRGRTIASQLDKIVVSKFAVEIFNLAELDSWFCGILDIPAGYNVASV